MSPVTIWLTGYLARIVTVATTHDNVQHVHATLQLLRDTDMTVLQQCMSCSGIAAPYTPFVDVYRTAHGDQSGKLFQNVFAIAEQGQKSALPLSDLMVEDLVVIRANFRRVCKVSHIPNIPPAINVWFEMEAVYRICSPHV
ncbi:hypothetical protein C8Q76DRAFT_792798 [Earliella scabrosa]|nr:hypothetical protein C8Q76DRAFT_792798 [Earliella scabrosa]